MPATVSPRELLVAAIIGAMFGVMGYFLTRKLTPLAEGAVDAAGAAASLGGV